MKVLAPDESGFGAAVTALKSGEVVAYPTETVYGLGVDPLSEAALDALYRVKARDPRHPVLIAIGALEQLDALTDDISETARRCMKAFWPGPLSLLFLPRVEVPSRLRDAEGRICVRLSSHPVAVRLALEFGGAITSTSANVSGAAPALSCEQVPVDGVSICLDDGVCAGTGVSTVFDSESNRILREGMITRVELDAVLGNT
jgi:L-threonylcarbamoyladenylate synthase